jgi:hypothetical protein
MVIYYSELPSFSLYKFSITTPLPPYDFFQSLSGSGKERGREVPFSTPLNPPTSPLIPLLFKQSPSRPIHIIR